MNNEELSINQVQSIAENKEIELSEVLLNIQRLEELSLPVYLYWNKDKTNIEVYSSPKMEAA